ncbi:MAG: hypothetical protein PHP48_09725 [Bacteroidales bacterium]|nr:hypothetical protein [Bacteroidales bacterium]MDD4087509.1 hypothetical protein [Bacteroidales bacterium]
MKKIVKYLFLVVFAVSIAVGSVSAQQLEITGFARNYTGVLLNDQTDFSIIQNTFNLNFEKRGETVGFKVNPMLYHYFDKEMDFRLREAYLDMYFNKFDLRIGQQQIIYGKAEGVFITDIVSPKDLSEFLLPDFDEIRMGVTAVKVNYYIGMNTLEAVWIPVFSPTLMPDSGSIWRPKIPFPVQPTYDYSTNEVKPSLEHSEFFLRYSAMTSKLDYEIVGGYHWSDDPVMHLAKTIDPVSMQLQSLVARPEYHRMGMLGGSLSTTFDGFVFRVEGSYNSGRYFQTENPERQDGTVSRDYLHYMAGLDYTLAGVKLSTQFIQEYIPDYETGMLQEEAENTMTFLAAKDYLREKLWLELFAYVGINKGDALIRPKVSYSFADGFDIQLGANIFVGDETGRFGQYRDNSMMYWKVKYSF